MQPKNIILISVGFLSLTVGAIGAFFPILPTTPFILLAAGCFSSSSPKLYRWLAGTKYFGDYIENYRNKTGVKKSVKRHSIIFLWLMLILSAVLFHSIYLYLVLLIVGISVSIHIALIKEKAE